MQLSFIYLSGNAGLRGTLPDMSSLHNLEILQISSTDINGTLPCTLTLLPRLKSIEASATRMSGCLSLECLKAAPECSQIGSAQDLVFGEDGHGVEL